MYDVDRKNSDLPARRKFRITCFVWMSLSLLAAATHARALVVPAQDDARILDIAKDGVPEAVSGGPEIQVSQSASLISAGVFEFNVAGIPAGARVTQVTLRLKAINPDGMFPNQQLIVRGYAGNGNVELLDFNAGRRVGAFVPQPGLNQVPIAEAFVQDVIDCGGQFAGVVVSELLDPATLDFTSVVFASTNQRAVMPPSLVIELEVDQPDPRPPQAPSFSIVENAAWNIRDLLAGIAPNPLVNQYQEDTVLGPPSPKGPFFGCCGLPFPPRIRLLGVPLPAPAGNPDIDVDGISFGRPEGVGFASEDLTVFFSVGRAQGLAQTDVALEAALDAREPISDIFATNPFCAAGDNKQEWDGNSWQLAPAVGPSPGLGLLEQGSSSLNALDMRAAKEDTDRYVFWTVTKATAENHDGPLGPFERRSGADVFVSGMADRYSDGIPVMYAAARQLGLNPHYDDDIDALVVADDGERNKLGRLFFDPAKDLVYLSLTDGSRTLAIRGWSPADVLSSGLGQGLNVFLPANMLGLARGDELDALDLVPWRVTAQPLNSSE